MRGDPFCGLGAVWTRLRHRVMASRDVHKNRSNVVVEVGGGGGGWAICHSVTDGECRMGMASGEGGIVLAQMWENGVTRKFNHRLLRGCRTRWRPDGPGTLPHWATAHRVLQDISNMTCPCDRPVHPRMVTCELSRVCWWKRSQHNMQHMQITRRREKACQEPKRP